MKTLLKIFILILFAISLTACSEEPPSFRIKNERTAKANVQIKTTSYTVNINDVESGTTTEYREVAEGLVEVTVGIQNESNIATGNFTALSNNNYTVIILDTNPASIRIDVSEK